MIREGVYHRIAWPDEVSSSLDKNENECIIRAVFQAKMGIHEGDGMKAMTILLAVAILAGAVGVCLAAEDVIIGTWKLNEAKSKISPGRRKNLTVVYAVVGDSVKATDEGVDANGKPFRVEWTGKFDGKDYAVTGDPANDTRAYKRINDHTLALIDKKNGKVTITGRITVSLDGKTRSVTTSVTDDKGTKTTSTQFYDKE